jgi:TPR repeat protein
MNCKMLGLLSIFGLTICACSAAPGFSVQQWNAAAAKLNQDALNAAAKSKAAAQAQKTAAQAAWVTNLHQVPIDPLRLFNGARLAANAPGSAKFWGTVKSVSAQGLIVEGSYTGYSPPPNLEFYKSGSVTMSSFTNVPNAFSGIFLITHFPPGRAIRGDSFNFQDPWWARMSGLVSISSTNLDRLSGATRITSTNFHALDYGVVVELTEQEMAAARATAQAALDSTRQALQANALASDQNAAANGDQSAQLEMGKRYRDGDGVPKDLGKAKEWFAKSAAQGNQQATRALANMDAAK